MMFKYKNYTIREIEFRDNKQVENVIRTCLIEFGGNHEGTAWMDPDLGRFSEIYVGEGKRYWVAEDENGKVVGGVGIGSFDDEQGICELQKMYCFKEARGTGIAHRLLETALIYAAEYYKQCYLETLDTMVGAQKFYARYGFYRLKGALGTTGHYACEVCLMKDLDYVTMDVNGVSYQVHKLLGKGKGGYSYLASRDGRQYVLKQIHHEPCDYYQFGDKIQSELNDYHRLKDIGIKIPELIAADMEKQRIVKAYIEGDTV